MNKILIGFLVVLAIFLIGCKKAATTPGTDVVTTSTQTGNQSGASKSLTFELDYCKNSVKVAGLGLNAAQRRVEKENRDLDGAKAKLQEAKALNDADDITKWDGKVKDGENALKNAQEGVTKAQGEVAIITQKCEKLNKKADSKICDEFTEDLNKKLADLNDKLKRDQEDLEKAKKLVENLKAAGKSSDFIKSAQTEVDEEELNILRDNNQIDKLNGMLTELKTHCGK